MEIVNANSTKSDLKCRICCETFNNRQNLKRHEFSHQSERPYSCQLCSRSFKRLDGLQGHMHLHKGKGSLQWQKIKEKGERFTCARCGASSFLYRAHLIRHLKGAHGPRPLSSFGCACCPARFRSKNALTEHFAKIHKTLEQPFKCPNCSRAFRAFPDLRKHAARSHSDAKPFTCSHCPASFKLAEQLAHHQTIVHSDVRKFRCSLCPKAFKASGDLSRHMSVHSDAKGFRCPLCPAAFKSQTNLARHRAEKHKAAGIAFNCYSCGASFTNSAALKRHARTHSFQRGFACPHCPHKPFRTNTGLAHHERTIHSPNNPDLLGCSHCGAMFQSHNGLLNHLRSHDAQRPYFECATCGVRLKGHFALKQHMISAHDGPRPLFRCCHCGLGLLSKVGCHAHILSHGVCSRAFFRCSVCSESFRGRWDLITHLFTHSDFRRYRCAQCPAQYKSYHSLWLHRRTRHLQKPPAFACAVCAAVSTSKPYLRRHLSSMHAEAKQ